MFLFTLLTFLTFLNAFASRIIVIVLKLLPRDKSIGSISSEIAELKKELSLIPMVHEFARYARLQRKINKLQDERESLVSGHAAKIASLKNAFLFATYTIVSVTLFILVVIYREEAVAELPPDWLWPVPCIFSWFTKVPGSVSVSSWIIMSSTVSKVLAKNF